jgi:molybdenum-dependent DNA-binding transcriptional regulator ModE
MGKNDLHLVEMLLRSKLHGRADALRARYPFSENIEATNAILFNPKYDKRRKVRAYRAWLQASQPCVFGRVAAKNKNAFICLLEGNEILRMKSGDKDLKDTLQDYRQVWKRNALEGLASSFVVVLVSPSLAIKEPNSELKEIARRLIELYMELDTIEDDTFQTQREYLFLKTKSADKDTTVLKFSTLPNIFCAQGDRRGVHRTWEPILERLLKHFEAEPKHVN